MPERRPAAPRSGAFASAAAATSFHWADLEQAAAHSARRPAAAMAAGAALQPGTASEPAAAHRPTVRAGEMQLRAALAVAAAAASEAASLQRPAAGSQASAARVE